MPLFRESCGELGIHCNRRSTPVMSQRHHRPSTLYERSMRARREYEDRIAQLRKISMRECTFTPNTSQSNRTSTTATMSSGDSWASRAAKSTTQGYSGRSCCSTASHRIEELYRVKVSKMRSRPCSDSQERWMRQRKAEERELKVCTFQPQTDWKRRYQQNLRRKQPKDKLTVRRGTNLHRRAAPPSHRETTHSSDPQLPKEIIIPRLPDSPNGRTASGKGNDKPPPVKSVTLHRHIPENLDQVRRRLEVTLALETGSI